MEFLGERTTSGMKSSDLVFWGRGLVVVLFDVLLNCGKVFWV